MGSPFALCSGLQNIHLHAKDDTSNPVTIAILFSPESLLPFGTQHVLFLV